MRFLTYCLTVCVRLYSNYGLDDEYTYLAYVEYLIVHPKAQRIPNYQTLVSMAASEVAADDLVPVVANAVGHIDGCDYERIHFVCRLLQAQRQDDERLPLHIMLLDMLRTLEVGVDGASGALKPGSGRQSTRLSFHQLVADPWSVLTPLLRPDNISTFLSLGVPLNLTDNDFYATLTRKTITAMVKQQQPALDTPQHDKTNDVGDSDRTAHKQALITVQDIIPMLWAMNSSQLLVSTLDWVYDTVPNDLSQPLASLSSAHPESADADQLVACRRWLQDLHQAVPNTGQRGEGGIDGEWVDAWVDGLTRLLTHVDCDGVCVGVASWWDQAGLLCPGDAWVVAAVPRLQTLASVRTVLAYTRT